MMGREVEDDDGDGGLVDLADAADVLEDIGAVALHDELYTRRSQIRINMESGKETHACRSEMPSEVDEDGAALLSAGLGDGAYGRNLVELPAQVVFPESRDRETPLKKQSAREETKRQLWRCMHSR
jgi:hypothetical protein